MDESPYVDIRDDNIAIGFPFQKIDVKNRTVEGYATLDNVDKTGEIVDAKASKEAFSSWLGNVREMHGGKAVGKALHFEERPFDEQDKSYNGIWVKAYISKGAEDTWEKILDGTLKGFSIGGRVLEKRPEVVKNDGDFAQRHVVRITKYTLAELSVVDNPANPLAMFGEAGVSKRSLVKFADGAIQASDVLADQVKIFYCSQCDVAKAEEYSIDEVECLTCENKMDMIGVSYEVPTRDVIKNMVLEKREFSTEERRRLAGTGAALPDGSFPISDEADLKNAIQAFGRAADKAKAKAHIIRRARAMGRTDLLPDSWEKAEIMDIMTEPVEVKSDDTMWSTPDTPTPSIEEPEVEEKQVSKSDDDVNDLQLKATNDTNIMNLLNQLIELVSKRSEAVSEVEKDATPVEGGEKVELDKETNLNGILDVLKNAVASVEEILNKWNVTRLNSEAAKDVEVAKPTSLPDGPDNNAQLQIGGSNGADMGTPSPPEDNVVPHSPMLGKTEEAESEEEEKEEKAEESEPVVAKAEEVDETLTKAAMTEELGKVTSKLDEAFEKVAQKFTELDERIGKIEGSGATKKSGEVNEAEDLKKSDSANTFWGGSFAPTSYH